MKTKIQTLMMVIALIAGGEFGLHNLRRRHGRVRGAMHMHCLWRLFLRGSTCVSFTTERFWEECELI